MAKIIPNFTEFHAMLVVMDRVAHDGADLFCTNPRQLEPGVYAYDYDALVPVRVQFHNDGSVTEWADIGDDRKVEDHQRHMVWLPSIKDWMEHQIKEVTQEPA